MSKAFRFPLQRILNFKDKIADEKSRHFQRSLAEVEREKQELAEIESTKTAALSEQRSRENEEQVSLRDIRLAESHVSQLNDRMEQQEKTIAQRKVAAESARQELLKATKEKRVIEKLRERQFAEHLRNERQRETVVENELAIRITQREQGS